MTPIAAIWISGAGKHVEQQLRDLLTAQRQVDQRDIEVWARGDLALGCIRRPLTLEDQAPCTLLARNRDAALVADVRLDNRAELGRRLGLRAPFAQGDAWLLLQAFDRWGESFTDYILGDYAIVIWSAKRQKFLLFRDPTGQRPLHFAALQSGFAIASTGRALAAHPQVGAELNLNLLAEFVADIPRAGSATYFQKISRVEPGQQVTLSHGGSLVGSFWRYQGSELRYARDQDYVEAFRELLDAATISRLQGVSQSLGTHLSSGIDSAAVTSTAARLLRGGGEVIAFTSSPRVGFVGAVPHGRSGDEAQAAAELAAAYPNIRHVIVRSAPESPLELLKREAGLYEEPIGLPCNQLWWSAIHKEANRRGLTVMLTGESGNYTLSAGGVSVLPKYLVQLRFWTWAQEVRKLLQADVSFRGAIGSSLAPWMPHKFWRLLNRQIYGRSVNEDGLMLLRGEYRAHAERHQHHARGERPPKDEAFYRWSLLRSQDPGNFRRGVFDRWGLDERDVASDRRLAEFCLSLPPDLLLRDGQKRRMAKLGLADRLPSKHWSWPRGYQGADWYERLNKEALLDRWGKLQRSSAVAAFLDVRAVTRLIEAWPSSGYEAPSVIAKFRLLMLRVMSASHFAEACSTAPHRSK